MIIKGVEFPEQVILDQRAGKLVIFAGAGVSLDRPSSLPTFIELTEDIISRKLKKSEKSQLDRILGSYKQKGANVHRIAKEIIDREGSLPTELHKALLNLFTDISSVRVVTTNFDRHFSTATRGIFGEPAEEFYAPALPLGHDFRGIVYLHGSLERDEHRFVLTDSDFGRAYLTEGWATRFLWDLFRTYTVLFVGYSHNDPVMHYLSKGLPSETNGKRYALTPENDAAIWDFLDIISISYPVPRRSHKAMTTAVSAWAKLSAMGALDYEHRIKTIVEGSTYLSEEDTSFLLYVIRHTRYAKLFTKHAENTNWFLWAEQKDLLQPLFKPDPYKEEYNSVLTEWIVDKYLISHTDALLSLIQRQGQYLNPILWNRISWKLFAQHEPTVISRIIPTLLKSIHPFNRTDELELLLMECHTQGLETVALHLFEFLTTPYLNLQRSFGMEGDGNVNAPGYEIEIHGSDHWMQEAWKKVFAPNIVNFAQELEVITSAQLLKADMLFKSYRGPDAFDPVSHSRSAIEPHEQDEHSRKLDVIINAARDSIEALIENDPGSSLYLINRWYGTGPEIMKRIALHALTESVSISADNKIQWLLFRELFFDTGCVHEVFRVLKSAYHETCDTVRNAVLEAAKKGYRGKNADMLDDNTKSYEIYNLLYWLTLADPACRVVSEAFQAFQEANPEFRPREYPDFHHWFGGVSDVEYESPKTAEELLMTEPATQLDFLLTFNGSLFKGPDRNGLLTSVTQAVQQNFDWGYKLALALTERSAWETDIWANLLRGWEDGLEDDSHLVLAIQLIDNNSPLFIHDYNISSLIQKRFNEKAEISEKAVHLAMRLAERLMDHIEAIHEQPPESTNDWLSRAINRSGGKLAEFWINILSIIRNSAGDLWTGLPDIPRRCLEKMIKGSSFDSQLARVFITSQLYFMFYMDDPWTKEKVIPLLDWSNPERARQCWDGYLSWGRYGENTLPYVMPLYRSTFPEVNKLRERLRRRFCHHMASIAIYSSINPLENGWITEFISSVEEMDRIAWAEEFGHLLRSIDDEAGKLMWEQWLNRYWYRRNLGQPVPLSHTELVEMIKWSVSLRGVFDKVVRLICDQPAPEISDTYIFHLMREKGFAKSHTENVGRLLIHLIPSMTKLWLCHELLPLARELREVGLDSKLFNQVQNGLIALGCIETI